MFWPPVSKTGYRCEAIAHDMGWPWKEVEDENPSEYWIHQGASEWPENHRGHIKWSKVYNPQIHFPRWRAWWQFEAKAIELVEKMSWAEGQQIFGVKWAGTRVSTATGKSMPVSDVIRQSDESEATHDATQVL